MSGITCQKKKTRLVFFCHNQTVCVPAHAGTFRHTAIKIGSCERAE